MNRKPSLLVIFLSVFIDLIGFGIVLPLLPNYAEENFRPDFTAKGVIIGGIYLLGGIAVGWFAYSELTSAGIAPTRTIEVLKQDQVWIQSEARTA